jgi:hypothetical protein
MNKCHLLKKKNTKFILQFKNTILFCLFLLLIACENVVVNNADKQEKIVRQYVNLIQNKNYNDAYNILDSTLKQQMTLFDFIAKEQFYIKITRRHGAELKLIKAENTYDDKMTLYSDLYFTFNNKLSEVDSTRINLLFRFVSGETKILEVKYFFNNIYDRTLAPFEIEKCNSEKVVSYFDKWYVSEDTIMINSISLLAFSKNKGIMAVKVVCYLPNLMDENLFKEIGFQIAQYAFQNGYYEMVKKEATKQRYSFGKEIGVTFWRPTDGATYSIMLNVDSLTPPQLRSIFPDKLVEYKLPRI